MSTAHAFFPVHVSYQQRRTPSLRDAGILCLAVALCCAASVFILLYHSDQSYPVAAVRNTSPQAVSYAVAARPRHAQRVNTGPTVKKSEGKQAPTMAPIARNHEELLELERQGERNYVEFSLARTSGFYPVGPVEIGLWRTDPKHASVQASILFKRRRIDFKRLKLNERVSIPAEHSQTLDLVVNKVTKNQITGYVSEPKNSGSE